MTLSTCAEVKEVLEVYAMKIAHFQFEFIRRTEMTDMMDMAEVQILAGMCFDNVRIPFDSKGYVAFLQDYKRPDVGEYAEWLLDRGLIHSIEDFLDANINEWNEENGDEL